MRTARARVTIVADVGSNWRDGPDEPLSRGRQRWVDTIRRCADAGVDVVKAQLLQASVYPQGSAEAQLVAGYEWPLEWLALLHETCCACGVEFLCTVFEPRDVPAVDRYVARWKIASFESQRTDLHDAIRRTGKPLIVSSGTLTQRECFRLWGLLAPGDTMLLCVSKYPAAPGDYDLRVLGAWEQAAPPHIAFGLSDHSAPEVGAVLAVGAVAQGASLVETHVTLSRRQKSPDAHFSRVPGELEAYVRDVRLVEQALGDGVKRVVPDELVEYRWSRATTKRGTLAPRLLHLEELHQTKPGAPP